MNSNTLAQYRSWLFQPLVVLLFSFTGAALYLLYKLSISGWKTSAFTFSGSFSYVVPIIVPFVAFLFDRAEHWRESGIIRPIVDVIVVGTAIGRVVANVPLVSGHSFFLTYALFSSRSRVVKVTSALVMVQVVYLKYFLWHDWVTSTSGIVLGLLAAYIANRFVRQKREKTHG